jgi:hypothetical protein
MAAIGPWKLRAELLGHEQVACGMVPALPRFFDIGVFFF